MMRWRWGWTGVSAKDTPGQRTRNIARSTGECCRQTRAKYVVVQRCPPLFEASSYPAICQVSKRAKKRGLPQLGTLGAGKHVRK